MEIPLITPGPVPWFWITTVAEEMPPTGMAGKVIVPPEARRVEFPVASIAVNENSGDCEYAAGASAKSPSTKCAREMRRQVSGARKIMGDCILVCNTLRRERCPVRKANSHRRQAGTQIGSRLR